MDVVKCIDIEYVESILRKHGITEWSIFQTGARFTIWVYESDLKRLKDAMIKNNYALLKEGCRKYSERCSGGRIRTVWIHNWCT